MHPEAITLKQKRIFDKLKSFPEYYLAGGTALALMELILLLSNILSRQSLN